MLRLPRIASSVLLVGALLALVPGAAQASPQDISTLVSRLRADYHATIATSSAASQLAAQQADGCWSDVDYSDTSAAGWKPVTHLERVKVMAAAYSAPGSAASGNAAMRTGVLKGIDCWYVKAPKSTNWWWNDIGKQLQLGPLGIMIKAELSSGQLAKIVADLPAAPKLTGQNRVWISQGVVQRGCLEQSEARIQSGIAGIRSTVLVTTKEGIQHDWSFHQHGAQLYSAGYGQGFIRDTAYWLNRVRGTSFAFAASEVDILLGLLLDGDAWMVRGQLFDYSADGREITRKNQSSAGLVRACDDLEPVAAQRTPQLQALRAHIEGTGPAPLTGNRHFFRSDFMAHQRPEFYASVKMCSARTVGTECINDENVLGKWLPFGLTYIARRGDEYHDIFPVWDWTLLPGVTAPAFTERPKSETQQTAAVGGVSNGQVGLAAMALDKASTSGRKAWFFFDRELVALGAAISSSRTEPVRTAVNQCLLQGPVVHEGKTLAPGTHQVAALHWVHHDGVGYLFPRRPAAVIRNQAQSGSWHDINLNLSGDTVTRDVFTLYLDHGVAPKQASYAYVVLAAPLAQMAGYAAQPPLSVLSNTAALQAVWHQGQQVGAAAFHLPGSVQLHPGLELTVDQPALVLVDEGASPPEVSVADPTGTLSAVQLRLQRPALSLETLTATLPTGARAGASVTLQASAPPAPDSGPQPVDLGPGTDGAAAGTDGAMEPPEAGPTPADAGATALQGSAGCALQRPQRGGAPWPAVLLLLLLWRLRCARGQRRSAGRSKEGCRGHGQR